MKITDKLHKLSEKKKEITLDTLFFAVGCFIYSASVAIFIAPNKMAPGGMTGIATILYYVFGTPIGLMIFILNIPLFILGFKFIGGKFMVKTLICTVVSSFGVDLLDFLPKYAAKDGDQMLLAALYGGITMGVGLALVFVRGATTGGTDIASRLLKLKWPYIPMGRMMMFVDTAIILVSVIAFKSIDSGLYAMIQLFVSSKVIDLILYGSDNGKMFVIISEKNHEIAQKIIEDLDRGVTLLKGRGFYTGNDKEVLLCAVRRQETSKVRTVVKEIDQTAFIIMCDASDVIGEGFKPINKDEI
jgi:uncharacterized membrane-anchored protein YitT (DUF2179 family)